MSNVANVTTYSNNVKAPCEAHLLSQEQRKQIALSVLEKAKKISHIAFELGISRKFVYQQREKALIGITKAFEENSKKDEDVLFCIPVTYGWIKQLALALVLICKASYSGVIELFRDLLDYPISKGTVHNIIHSALVSAQKINGQQDLSSITVGAHDEIYQAGNPVLAGCCAHTTYCYLLSQEDSCDTTTWGVHLLNLSAQGLNPNHTIADGGPSARKGHEEAWPDTPCHGDVFHALYPFSKMIAYIDNRALDAARIVEELSAKIINPRGKWKEEQQQIELLVKIEKAEEES
ncbi:MAG: hypothetical protein FJZ63_07425, partial [Chlamydiae bacterium]|nr:hypothetical protein [Chlamydiota bacterium]